jgi:hypothetical protein
MSVGKLRLIFPAPGAEDSATAWAPILNSTSLPFPISSPEADAIFFPKYFREH